MFVLTFDTCSFFRLKFGFSSFPLPLTILQFKAETSLGVSLVSERLPSMSKVVGLMLVPTQEGEKIVS